MRSCSNLPPFENTFDEEVISSSGAETCSWASVASIGGGPAVCIVMSMISGLAKAKPFRSMSPHEAVTGSKSGIVTS